MFGDGVNDAAALSRATIGVSVADAADVARSAADVFVSRRGPLAFAELVSLSHNTMRTISRNVVIAVAYNALGASLAMAGLISPLWAALLMPLSSVTVLTLAVRALSRERVVLVDGPGRGVYPGVRGLLLMGGARRSV